MYLKILIFLMATDTYWCQNAKLKQVLILSRHNARTPLSKNLFEFTPKQWPTWREKPGYLTAKGALLEGFMGDFFSSWLRAEGIFNEKCPDDKSFYVYANNKQRTIKSAESFVDKAFPLCNITIHHTDSQEDRIFNPVIHNSSNLFTDEAKEQMLALLNSLKVNNSAEYLENILDYKQSKYCLLKHKCSLITDKNKIFVKTGFKPNLEGPLKISKSVIDSFIMENYEGFPNEEVAWSTLQNDDQWNAILDLTRGYHDIIFNTTLIAKDVAHPLLKFMADLLLNKQYKVIFLMGHDSNIYTILKSMSFKPFILKNQYERAPAGGKIVFQKWLDSNTGLFFLKVDFVYQGTKQMRDGKKLSMANPPEFTPLELNGCNVQENGFCLWDDFVKLLQGFIDKYNS